MGRTVRRRKCSEHPDCVLQRVDEGDWEHVHQARPIRDVLSGRFDQAALKQELAEGLAKAKELSRHLTEQKDKVEARFRRIETDTDRLPTALSLQRDAAKANERLFENQARIEVIAQHLRHRISSADTALNLAESRLRDMHEVQERIDKSLHDGEELVTHFTERINQMDSIFARFDKGLEKLGNLDKLYESVEQMVEDQRQENITLHLRLDEMDRRITHERDERIAATRKSVRTDLLLSQRLEGLTDASR